MPVRIQLRDSNSLTGAFQFQVNFAGRPFYQLGVGLFKLALCVSYLRLLDKTTKRPYRFVVYFMAAFSTSGHVACTLVLIFNCRPVWHTRDVHSYVSRPLLMLLAMAGCGFMGSERQGYMSAVWTNKLLPRWFHDSMRSNHYRLANSLAAESQNSSGSQGWCDLSVSARVFHYVLLGHAPYADPDDRVRRWKFDDARSLGYSGVQRRGTSATSTCCIQG